MPLLRTYAQSYPLNSTCKCTYMHCTPAHTNMHAYIHHIQTTLILYRPHNHSLTHTYTTHANHNQSHTDHNLSLSLTHTHMHTHTTYTTCIPHTHTIHITQSHTHTIPQNNEPSLLCLKMCFLFFDSSERNCRLCAKYKYLAFLNC